MKIKLLSMDATASLGTELSQKLVTEMSKKYFDEVSEFKNSTDLREMLTDLSESLKDADVIFIGVETSVFLSTKKALMKALSLPTVNEEKIESLISTASSRTSDEEKAEHSLIPKGAVILLSDNGLFSGFAVNAGSQWIIFAPVGTKKLTYMLTNQIEPFIKNVLKLNEKTQVEESESKSEVFESIKRGVFALRQAESKVAFAATKSVDFVKEECARVSYADEVVFFSDYYRDRDKKNIKKYLIDLAVGAKKSMSGMSFGVALSNVLQEENDKENTYFMYIAVTDDESAKVAKIYGTQDESTKELVFAAISTAFSLIHDKSVERFEKKKNGLDYEQNKKSADDMTDYEINVRKRRIGTAVRIILALLAFAALGVVAVCVFGGYAAKLPLLMGGNSIFNTLFFK